MESLLVRLTDDAGRVGWGETFGHLINPVTFAALEGPVGRWFKGAEFEPTSHGIAALRFAADRALHAFGAPDRCCMHCPRSCWMRRRFKSERENLL